MTHYPRNSRRLIKAQQKALFRVTGAAGYVAARRAVVFGIGWPVIRLNGIWFSIEPGKLRK